MYSIKLERPARIKKTTCRNTWVHELSARGESGCDALAVVALRSHRSLSNPLIEVRLHLGVELEASYAARSHTEETTALLALAPKANGIDGIFRKSHRSSLVKTELNLA